MLKKFILQYNLQVFFLSEVKIPKVSSNAKRLILEFDYFVCESCSENYSIYQRVILGWIIPTMPVHSVNIIMATDRQDLISIECHLKRNRGESTVLHNHVAHVHRCVRACRDNAFLSPSPRNSRRQV